MIHRRLWLALASAAALVFLYVPIGVLILFSFNAARLSSSWRGFTLDWYRILLADQALLTAALNSLVIAAVSTALALGLGVAAALGLERLSVRRQSTIEGAMLLPLIIPEIMMGVALMLLFVMVRWPLSLTTVVIGHVVFNLPLVVVIVRARLRKLDPKLMEAARDLGAGTWQVYRRVTEPLMGMSTPGRGSWARAGSASSQSPSTRPASARPTRRGRSAGPWRVTGDRGANDVRGTQFVRCILSPHRKWKAGGAGHPLPGLFSPVCPRPTGKGTMVVGPCSAAGGRARVRAAGPAPRMIQPG